MTERPRCERCGKFLKGNYRFCSEQCYNDSIIYAERVSYFVCKWKMTMNEKQTICTYSPKPQCHKCNIATVMKQ